MKLLFTGGHMTPALAIIDELLDKKNADTSYQIVFAGRRYTGEGETVSSLEYREVTKRGVSFIDVQAPRIPRSFSRASLFRLIQLPKAYVHAYKILKREKPDVIMTFGSYVGLPVAICGWLMGIPVYMHEQTIKPGLSNQLIGQFARHIYVAFPQAADFFDKKKTTVSGNPLRKHIFEVIKTPFQIRKTHPILYITGGSLGSHSINELMRAIIPKLLKRAIVIHQTGNVQEYNDFERLRQMHDKLPHHLKQRYFLRKHIYADEVGYVYRMSDLVIGRSGANTFFELIALKKPAIFIPLPWAAGHEQERHAQIFVEYGVGELFDQSQSPKKLLHLIYKVLDNISAYKRNFTNLDDLYKRNAVQIILKKSMGG